MAAVGHPRHADRRAGARAGGKHGTAERVRLRHRAVRRRRNRPRGAGRAGQHGRTAGAAGGLRRRPDERERNSLFGALRPRAVHRRLQGGAQGGRAQRAGAQRMADRPLFRVVHGALLPAWAAGEPRAAEAGDRKIF